MRKEETMINIALSWFHRVEGSTYQGEQLNPEWSFIEEVLEKIRVLHGSGSISLDITDHPDDGPQTLGIQFSRERYLITLGEINDGLCEVRSLSNIDALPGQIEIQGNLWDSKMVTDDFALVMRLIKEFFVTGNVSHDLLTF